MGAAGPTTHWSLARGSRGCRRLRLQSKPASAAKFGHHLTPSGARLGRRSSMGLARTIWSSTYHHPTSLLLTQSLSMFISSPLSLIPFVLPCLLYYFIFFYIGASVRHSRPVKQRCAQKPNGASAWHSYPAKLLWKKHARAEAIYLGLNPGQGPK